MLNTFIFDLDETLVHTEPEYRYLIFGKATKELGLETPDKAEIDDFWFGMDRNKKIQELFNINPEIFWDCYRKYDVPDLRKGYASAFPDAKEVIKFLRKYNYKFGVFSEAKRDIINFELGLLKPFNVHVVVRAEKGNKKPYPTGLMECMRLLRAERNETAYVGDTKADVLTARNAGVLDVYLNRRGERLDIKPTVEIKSLNDIKHLAGRY